MKKLLLLLLFSLCFFTFTNEIKKANENNLTVLSPLYSKDKNNVYFIDRKIGKADPETFETFKESLYAKDKNSVYYKDERLKNADPETFIVLENFGKDKNHVYFEEKEVIGADSKTFVIQNNSNVSPYFYIAKDKNYTYKVINDTSTKGLKYIKVEN